MSIPVIGDDPSFAPGGQGLAKVEIATTVERFIELEQAWGVLWQKTRATAFQSHPWVAAWVKHMGRSYELKIGLIWQNDGTLSAVLPMAVRRFLGLRILEWAGQEVCEYCDGLGDLANLQTAWKALRAKGGIDVVRLRHIGSDTEVTSLFTSGFLLPDDVCPQLVSSWESGDDWFRSLKGKKRYNILRGQRILRHTGIVSMVCYESAPDEALVRRLFELKVAWLKANGKTSYLFDDEHPGRLLRFVQALAQVSRLRLFVITCGDDIVSASINIADGSSVYGFVAAYNPKFDRTSPGTLLLTAVIRWAFDNGFTKVNFGRGEADYKLDFANVRSTLLSFSAAASLRGRTALIARRGLLQIAKFREKHKRHLGKGRDAASSSTSFRLASSQSPGTTNAAAVELAAGQHRHDHQPHKA